MNIAEKILDELETEGIRKSEQLIFYEDETLRAMKEIAWQATLAYAKETHTRLCELLHVTNSFKEDGVKRWFEQWYNKDIDNGK